MIKPMMFLFVLTLFACSSSKTQSVQFSEDAKNQDDTTKYKAISTRFYQGQDGKIYIKTQSLRKAPEEYGPVFYREVPVADVESYVVLSGFYGKDKINIYRDFGTTDGQNIVIIEEADAETFSVINYRLGRDKSHVFYNGKIIEGVDINSLVILCENPGSDYPASYSLFKDDKNVYYQDLKIETIDAKTFECVRKDSVSIYQDKYWIYQEEYFPSMNPDKRIKRE